MATQCKTGAHYLHCRATHLHPIIRHRCLPRIALRRSSAEGTNLSLSSSNVRPFKPSSTAVVFQDRTRGCNLGDDVDFDRRKRKAHGVSCRRAGDETLVVGLTRGMRRPAQARRNRARGAALHETRVATFLNQESLRRQHNREKRHQGQSNEGDGGRSRCLARPLTGPSVRLPNTFPSWHPDH